MVKNRPASTGDVDSIPGLGRSPGEGNGNPLQYCGLENSMGPWGRKESDTTELLSLSFTLLRAGSVACFHVSVH